MICYCGRELTTTMDMGGQCSMCGGAALDDSSQHAGCWTPNYGWTCPKCGAVYAPYIPVCSICNCKEQP